MKLDTCTAQFSGVIFAWTTSWWLLLYFSLVVAIKKTSQLPGFRFWCHLVPLTQITLISQYHNQLHRSLHTYMSVSTRGIPGNVILVGGGNTGLTILKFWYILLNHLPEMLDLSTLSPIVPKSTLFFISSSIVNINIPFVWKHILWIFNVSFHNSPFFRGLHADNHCPFFYYSFSH